MSRQPQPTGYGRHALVEGDAPGGFVRGRSMCFLVKQLLHLWHADKLCSNRVPWNSEHRLTDRARRRSRALRHPTTLLQRGQQDAPIHTDTTSNVETLPAALRPKSFARFRSTPKTLLFGAKPCLLESKQASRRDAGWRTLEGVQRLDLHLSSRSFLNNADHVTPKASACTPTTD